MFKYIVPARSNQQWTGLPRPWGSRAGRTGGGSGRSDVALTGSHTGIQTARASFGAQQQPLSWMPRQTSTAAAAPATGAAM